MENGEILSTQPRLLSLHGRKENIFMFFKKKLLFDWLMFSENTFLHENKFLKK